MSVNRKTLLQTGLVTSNAKHETASRSWVCRVIRDDGAGQQIAVGARPVRVGADRHCDLILEDAKVSRNHAELQATPEGIKIRDLGSTNGTFWQGSRIDQITVTTGTTVQFGETAVGFSATEIPSLPPSDRDRFGGLVGDSLQMRELYAVLELVSPSPATILLEGESGTGKELAARAIHDHSDRAAVPLVTLDCSAISETLIDSHLFGHVRGAFTGANTERKGAFVEANGGTLFIDEIGELSLESQTKLLRALEAQTVQPVGSDKAVSIDTRVIAATHRNLSQMVDAKRFRFDLFYRLAVVHVRIPPLRERIGDLTPLVRHFYEGRNIDPGPIAGDNLSRIQQHSWPGNVRELRNVLERAWALSGTNGGSFADLRLWVTPMAHGALPVGAEIVDTSLSFKEAKTRWVDSFERRYLAAIFASHNGNITHAADHAGINRRHFRTLLRKHGILAG